LTRVKEDRSKNAKPDLESLFEPGARYTFYLAASHFTPAI
jgi:hypothetical protein